MGNILLYGGTFDPPHKGHLHLLKSALGEREFHRVFLIPAYIPPHKDHRPALSFEMRSAILRDWFGQIKGLEILDIEQQRGGRSYTVDTVTQLQERYPNDTLHLLMGSDMFLSFETWFRFKDLLKTVVLVVGTREIGDRSQLGAHRARLMEQYDCKGILLCNMEALVCASSDLRAAGQGMAERILAHISSVLDVDRARHTMLVADYARALAKKNGFDEEKAYLAGLLHDCTKCYSHEWHRQYAQKYNVELSEADLACPQVLHQITAPLFAREELGVEDEDLLSAVGCHTTGKIGMSDLDRVLFFADSCEPGRSYPGVEDLRRAGEQDLKKGVLLLLEHMIAYLESENVYLHPKTLAARDDILKEFQKNG